MAEQRPHRSALSLFCLCCLFVHTLFMCSTGGNTLYFFICPFLRLFLCFLIRNCFNRTNHHYVSSQKKIYTAVNFCFVGFCTGINIFGKRNWQVRLELQNVNDAATLSNIDMQILHRHTESPMLIWAYLKICIDTLSVSICNKGIEKLNSNEVNTFILKAVEKAKDCIVAWTSQMFGGKIHFWKSSSVQQECILIDYKWQLKFV